MKKIVQSSRTEGDETHRLDKALAQRLGRRSFLKGALATAPLLIGAPTLLLPRKSAAATNIGPSTTIEPYLIPSVPGVKFVSILTVGDEIGGYRMVGIPDGLGAFQSARGQFTLLMNHEINPTGSPSNPGIIRKHGSNGAFVSRWIINQQTLKVLKGEDRHIRQQSTSVGSAQQQLRAHRAYHAVAPALFSGFAAQQRSLR